MIGALGAVFDMFDKRMKKLDFTIRLIVIQEDYDGKFCPYRDSG